MTTPLPPLSISPPKSTGWLIACTTAIFACLGLKSLVNIQVIPFWGNTDPMREIVIDVGLKPAQIMILDAVVLIASALLIALGASALSRLWSLAALLTCIASGWIIHSITRGSHDPTLFEQELMASAWISGLFAMLGLWKAATTHPSVRWLGLSVFIAVCLALVIKGGMQIFIEHPQMVQNFKANREAIFAANGWTSDSAAARGYERRILQPEASGFTGFSNVTASFLLAALAGLTSLFLAVIFAISPKSPTRLRDARHQPPRRWHALVIMLAALASGLGVVWTGSKAGQLLAIAGTAAGLLSIWWLHRSHRAHHASASTAPVNASHPLRKRLASLLAVLPLAMSLAVVLGVIARGLLGERLAELSVLFRWHYLIGSLRAFATDPITGVGIDGFQSVYARVKVPFSPEDVSSPHFQILEWIAVLGLGGVAMSVALLLALFASGWRNSKATSSLAPAPTDLTTYLAIPDRWMMRAAVLLAAVITLASLHVMREALTGGELMLRLAVLLLVVLGVKFILNLLEEAAQNLWLDWLDTAARFTLLIIAGLLIAHSQFELTGTNIQTSGLVLAMLGLAAGSARSSPQPQATSITASSKPALALRALTAAVALGLAMGCVLIQQAFSTMQSQLATSARAWGTVREIQANLEQAIRNRDPGAMQLASLTQQATQQALREHAALEDHRWWMTPRGYWPMARSSSQSLMVIARQLQQMAQQMAAAGQNDQARAAQVRALWLIVAAERAVLVPYTLTSVQEAIDQATTAASPAIPSLSTEQAFTAGRSSNVTRLAWLSAVYEEWARQAAPFNPAQSTLALDRALLVATQAAQREPYALPPALKVMRLALASNNPALAKTWASEALQRNTLQRLDAEVRGLSPLERQEVDRVLQSP